MVFESAGIRPLDSGMSSSSSSSLLLSSSNQEPYHQQSADNSSNNFPTHAGISKHILAACKETDVSSYAIFYFCGEGDNADDALTLASVVNRTLLGKEGLKQVLVPPLSWDYLYGR